MAGADPTPAQVTQAFSGQAAPVKRGRGRPPKNPPAAPAAAAAPPMGPTKDDIAALQTTAQTITILLGDMLHARNGAFPNDPQWQAFRVTATLAMVNKHLTAASKYAVELNFFCAWGLSLLIMSGASGNLAKLVPNIGKRPAANTPSAPAAPPAEERTIAEARAELAATEKAA